MWRNDKIALAPVMAVCRAMADEQRVRILMALAPGELCVCQVVELLGLATSTVSKHLSILRDAGLVRARKQGRWMHYRLADDEPAPPFVRSALAWLRESLAGDRAIAEDARALKAILKIDPEDLCSKQRPGADASSACCSSAPATPAAARSPKRGRVPSMTG